MTEDLYRKEALEHRDKSLYGEVILTSPPNTWLITFILIAVVGLIGLVLFFGRIGQETGSISILEWLLNRSR